MPRETIDDDWDDESWEEDDWSDDSSEDWEPDDEEEEEDTIPCPYCQKMIHADSVQCPHCGNYLSREDEPTQPKATWLIVGFILAFAVMLIWVMGGI